MKRFTIFTAALVAAASLAAMPALAQYANEFTPAKVTHEGKTSHAIAGSGSVTVQVQVNPDGSHKVIKVIRSSNHGDDAAALDIAQTSTYTPAHKGKTPTVSFYDFVLKFNGSSVAAGGQPESGGDIDSLIRAGKYQDAIGKANAALAANPNDQQAALYLGVAEYYSGDQEAAAAAFDKVSTVSKNFVPVAAQAYANSAVKASQTDPARSLAWAQKAMALQPDTNSRFALAVAQVANKQYSDAIPNLKQVRDALPASQAKAKENVDTELLQSYLAVNDVEDAQKAAADMKALDPSGTAAARTMAQHYLQTGVDAIKAKKYADAVSAFQQAADQGDPDSTVTADTYAAFAILQSDAPNYAQARDLALKALAVKADDPQANYAAGVAYAGVYATSRNDSDKKQALAYLNKADQYAKAAGNTTLASQAEAQIKTLSQSLQQ